MSPASSRWRPRVWLAVLLGLLAWTGERLDDELRRVLEVDAGETRARISPLLYGQLLEHAGRSIQGGVWAEMLEDRKFYFPVDGAGPGWTQIEPWGRSPFSGAGEPYEALTRSPWEVVGPPDAVAMDSASAFVGEHAPRVTLDGGEPRGIAHPRLGLVEGREYVGRIWLAGDASAAPIEVRLVWGERPEQRATVVVDALAAEYRETPLRFRAGGSTASGRLEIVGVGRGTFRVGTASLMPADHVQGLRADTLALLERLAPTIVRWPGGDFVSGYDFRDGLGPPDRRPPRRNPAWPGVEPNDFGLHEFMDLCERLGAEPYVVVNTGRGDADLAASEVEYANGAPDTAMGRLRVRHGRTAPWGVRWWGIGNEIWASWQIGHAPVERYLGKHARVVTAMREVDPSIRTVAVGEIGEWDEQMLAHAHRFMDLISAHVYVDDHPSVPEHVARLSAEIERHLDAHRRHPRRISALRAKPVHVAVDEWAYWYGPYRDGPLGVRHFLRDALGVAVALHTFFESSDLVTMANWAQAVNSLGCIKTSATAATFSAACLPLVLYRHHFGVIPVEVGHVPRGLHATAAWTQARDALTVALVNPAAEPASLRLAVAGATLRGDGVVSRIAGDDPMQYEEPGRPSRLAIETSDLDDVHDPLTLPAYSVSLYRLPTR